MSKRVKIEEGFWELEAFLAATLEAIRTDRKVHGEIDVRNIERIEEVAENLRLSYFPPEELTEPGTEPKPGFLSKILGTKEDGE